MRNTALRNCIFLLVTGLATIAQTPTQVTLVNPGFEAPYGPVNQASGVTTITGQVANGWLDNSSQANATIQYAQETSNPHGGVSCQKIVVVNPGSGQAIFYTGTAFPVQPGNIYTASIWIRGTPGVVARVLVRQSSAPSKNLLENDIELTANWQQVVASGYVTVSDTATLQILIPTATTVWVDDAAVSYTPGTIAPAPNLGPIPSSFFGMHVQNFVYNQLWNPGFEPPYGLVGVNNAISGQIAANWHHNISTAGAGGEKAVFSQDTTNPHSGTSSQKIVSQAGTSGTTTQLIEDVALVPGATYTVSAWFRGDPTASVSLALVQVNPSRTYAQTPVKLTGNWQQVSVSGQVPAGDTGPSRIVITISSAGTFWVDDVSLTDAYGQPISGAVPWPTAGFGTLRIWQERRTSWTGLEPAKGQWNWGPLDSIVAAAQAHGVDILLTLGQTPGWASPIPDAVTSYGAGATAPPTNIQDWRDYVTAVAQRYKGRIRYYEIWNEPNGDNFYSGTLAQLATLSQEAYAILKAVDPANTVVSAPPSLQPEFTPASVAYFDRMLAAGIGKYADILGVHIYTNKDAPEATAATIATVRLVMAKYKLDKMPLWDTEASSGDDTTAPAVAARYIARKYLTELAFGSVRYDWFAWDNVPTDAYPATMQTDRRGLTAAGRAYGFVYNWLVGSTLTQAAIDAAGTWQVWVTRPDGTRALVVWNPTNLTQFPIPSSFAPLSIHDLSGGVRSVTGTTIAMTDSPIFVTSTVDVPPLITTVNVAGGGSEISQNAWIEIRGNRLVPADTPANGVIWSSAPEFAAGRMPTVLGNVPLEVTVNGISAYLYFYCSAATNQDCPSDQINVLTPLDGTTGPVQVTVYTGIYSVSFTVSLRPASPSFPLYGGKYLVATHANYTLVGPASLSAPGYPITPATPNETIALYAFGFGAPKTALVSGAAYQGAVLPTLPVCQIGGLNAAVGFAGVVSPGLYLLTVTVPAAAPNGDNVILCTYNGATTPAGDLIAVQR